jgi:hypothetical protein
MKCILPNIEYSSIFLQIHEQEDCRKKGAEEC